MLKKIVLAGVWMCIASATMADETFVWIEGEKPATKNVAPTLNGWGDSKVLSGEAWLSLVIEDKDVATKTPSEGALIAYEFDVKSAGNYEVWDRLGYANGRSAFEWRIDQGQWQTVKPEQWAGNMMEIAGFCQVSWLKLGQADLTAGKHKIEFRIPAPFVERAGKKVPQTLRFACDAICISKEPFHPFGRYKPGEEWQTDADKQAAEQAFELKGDGAGSPDRAELPLSGTWQVARFDEDDGVVDRTGATKTLPEAKQARWMATTVPGNKFKDRAELLQCHRMVYRTHVKVPAEFAGRSFYLHFPAISLMGSLIVNGQYCGFTKAPYALWECDATAAIKPGQVNEICVVIKDSYYAITPVKTGQADTRQSFGIWLDHFGNSWVHALFDFPIGAGIFNMATTAGILLPPSMVVAGPVYSNDVFAIPSVKDKTLGLEITLSNPGAKDRMVQVANEIVPVAGGKAEKAFAAKDVTVPAGKEQVITLSESWDSPKLWWPEDPQMYRVVTRTLIDGKVADVRQTPFGFRQWQWDGPQFKLNGVPWNVRGDWGGGDAHNAPNPPVAESMKYYRKANQNSYRFWNPLYTGKVEKARALDELDAVGMIVRRNSIMDGMGCNYAHALAKDPALFDNWILQLKAMVKEERNHPSILIWSMENELTLINARNCGILDAVEPHIKRAAKALLELDPTRPVMIDGGNALKDQSLPVNGAHYIETSITAPGIAFREYPDQAYTWEKIIANEKKLWPLAMDKPVFMGECFFASGCKPGEYAQVAGEGCFAGWGEDTTRGIGLLARMMTEGFRWKGIAAWQLCLGGATLHHNSQAPVCVFCRQWNWTFGGGAEIARTLKVFNDTHYTDPIDVAWELTVDGKRVAGESRTFALASGEHKEFEIAFKAPPVAKRTGGEFVLTCTRDGKEVWRDAKPLFVIDPDAGPKPALARGDLVVLDPFGSVKARLTARGIAFTEAATFADIPANAKLVVVGKDALSAREATDPKWVALAGNGTKVLVLDQAYPLSGTAVPADLTPTDFVGRIALEERLDHPIFAGLDRPDFFTWSKDHVVYRNVYAKAACGANSLAHCDEQLGYSAIAECPVNDGLLLLCQMVVGEKLALDPVAQRLFDNMLAYSATYVPVRYQTAVAMPQCPALKLLTDAGLSFDKAADVVSAMVDGEHQIVVFDATPAALKSLADSLDKVKTFTAKGGWLMPWGLTPEGLASFNKIVGVDHLIRPFELESVLLPAVRDPVLSGLTVRDVAMESAEQIFGWAGTMYMVDDEFSWIVDLNDIAPFCDFPGAKAGDKVAARKAMVEWPRNVVNGFTTNDAWKLIYYLKTSGPKVLMNLPRPEEVTGFSIVLNCDYAKPRKVNLYFDADATPVSLVTKPDHSRQSFPVPPRKASKIVVELADFEGTSPTTGIDNLWITVKRPDDWQAKVKPLLNIGGLVKYPMGQGGIVLNQLNARAAEANPVNMQKKRSIVQTLLRNLHATFSGGKVYTTANLKYQPLALDEQCNQYLSKDRGWFAGDRDLSHMPVGQTTLTGVTYLVRDFKTSPVPSCVMLGGPGAKGKLPLEVRDLRAGSKADVLFFLHTFNRTTPWKAGKPTDAPPTAFKYVIHYADGQMAEVPVLYGQGVDHWINPNPTGVKSASVAWSAPFSGDSSKDQAVVYQFQWNNPRPDVAISGIDVTYGPDGPKWGTPAVLAITAATAK
jgi:hypothetical protein